MKNIFIIIKMILILFLLNNFALAQTWKNQHNQINYHLRSICMIDSYKGLAIGQYGKIIKTTDSGNSWFEVNNGLSSLFKESFRDMIMFNSNIGIIIGEGSKILKTTNFGNSWSFVGNASAIHDEYYDILKIDSNKCWVVGNLGNLLYSTDKGSTWSKQQTNTRGRFQKIYFKNSSIGWITGDSLYKTTNGGATWSNLSISQPGTKGLMDIYFVNDYLGYAVGSYNRIMKTTNGGSSWFIFNETYPNCYKIYFNNSSIGWIIGTSGTILKTTNGGSSWTDYSWTDYTKDKYLTYYDISFVDNNNGWIVGQNGTIYKTTNAGLEWLSQNTASKQDINKSFFINKKLGFAVGYWGTLLKTSDSGFSWNLIETNITNYCYDIHFIDSLKGFIVGTGGTILKTENAGSTWSKQNSGLTVGINSIYFIDSLTGFLVGEGGIIKKTTNLGIDWTDQSSGVTSSLYRIHFKDKLNGIIIGNTGVILKTSNGGQNWGLVNSGTDAALNDFHFISNDLGWIAGNGLILKTTNGGYDWSKVFTIQKNLIGVSFIDANNGFVVGSDGTILKTTDGGNSWLYVQYNKYPNFNDILFLDSGHGWIFGEAGTIFRYDSTSTFVNSPSLSNPLDTATNVSLLPQFNWSLPNNATYCRLQISNNSNFSGFIFDDTLSSNNFKLPANLKLNVSSNYYWRVKAYSDIDSSLWANYFTFTTQPTIQKPVLNLPEANSTGVSIYPNFSWNSVTNADLYVLQVSESVHFTNRIVNDTNTTTSRTITTPLNGTTNYYWRVKAINEVQVSDWANYRKFTTEYIGLPTAVLSQPSDNATLVVNNPNLSWSSVSGATAYRVQLSTNSNFSTFVVNTTVSNTNYDASGLNYFTSYYWRIRAVNSQDSSNWSQVRTFKTKDVPLDGVILSQPANNTTGIDINPQLSWNSLQGATSYELQVSINSSFNSFVVNEIGLTNITYNLTNLNLFTVYYWRVRAKNNTEIGAWSSTWNFRTVSEPLGTPSLTTPTNNATGVATSPSFQWSSVNNATKYDLQVATSSSFTSPIINQINHTSTTYNGSGLSNGTLYYWRVRAKNDEQTGDWSSTNSFTTASAPPSSPSLINPNNNSTNIATNTALSWQSVSGATSYIVQVSTANTFVTTVINQSGITSTNYNTSGLSRSTDFYWRVKAVNDGGESNWSQVWKFTTVAAESVPGSWAFTDLTGNNATIVVPTDINPKIGERSFVNGDAVGYFFTRDNQKVCAGYTVWDGNNLSITVWGDNSETQIKDGFSSSENYFVKIWDGQAGKEYEAEVSYSQGNNYYSSNGFSVVSSLKAKTSTTHEITLNTGWNMISTYIEPEQKSMPLIWDSVKTNVTLVKNNAGQTYIPAYNINGIGNWNKYEGYQAFMTQSRTLRITGSQIKPEDTQISLSSGWKIVSYLRNSSQSAPTALATLVSQNALTLCKNNAGQTYIPQYNINQIGSLQPGQGYQMYLSKNATLTYPANSSGRADAGSEITPMPRVLMPEHKITGNNSILLVQNDSPNGNEIGVYNQKDKLIGSGIFHNGIASVTIWGDNEYTEIIDGAVINEELRIKNYNAKTGRLTDIELIDLVDIINDKKVDKLTYSKEAFLISKINNLNSSSTISLNVIPNPASEYIEIEFNTPDCKASELKIYSTDGKLVADLSTNLSVLQSRKITQNISNYASGEYHIILSCGSDRAMQKVVIVK
ncbi:hypothetical protein MASR1M45_02500 [Candidatus Kapaibacterium sp.]